MLKDEVLLILPLIPLIPGSLRVQGQPGLRGG